MTNKPPEFVPFDFLEDSIAFACMFYSGTVACTVHGTELQNEMEYKYSKTLMQWLFDTVGRFEEDESE